MLVTDKGQVTIPKPLRDAAGIGPGTRVTFVLSGGSVVVTPVSTRVTDDRRERMKVAGAKAWRTMDPAFQQLSADEIMEFIRGDGPTPLLPSSKPRTKLKPASRIKDKPFAKPSADAFKR